MKVSERIRSLSSNSALGLSANQLRIVVAIERAVARLEEDPKLRDHLIFKGGFVLLKTIGSARFTRDLDALAYDIDQDKVPNLARIALAQDLRDELWFVDFQSESIPDQGEYGGLRLNCAFQIGNTPPDPTGIKKLSRLHIDIGFGDTIPRTSIKPSDMPSILDEGPVSWKVYPLEFIFAEKLQTLIARGSANSRAKDIFDLVEVFPKCSDPARLRSAIREVFLHRRTELPSDLVDFVDRFDLVILKSAWGSVDVARGPQSFEEYWRNLLKTLQRVSRVLKP